MTHMDRYYVAADSQYNEGQTVFLVDRRRDRTKWWTPELSGAMGFYMEGAAESRCRSYRFNNVRVVTAEVARMQDSNNRELQEEQEERHLDYDPGWNAHKLL